MCDYVCVCVYVSVRTCDHIHVCIRSPFIRVSPNTQGSGPMLISEVSFNSIAGEFLCNSLCYISDSKLASTTWFTAVLTCSLSACVLVPVISFIFTQPTEHWPDRRSNCCNCCTDNWSHHCHHCFLLPLEEETVRVSHGTKVRYAWSAWYTLASTHAVYSR